jgi:parvulin-like peptidyl-prolyl isomerase
MKTKLALFVSIGLISLSSDAATITITIDDLVYQRVLDAFAAQNKYQATIQDQANAGPIPNPEMKDKFMNRIISQFIQENVASAEARQASLLAVNTAIEDVKSKISGAIQVQSVAQAEIK